MSRWLGSERGSQIVEFALVAPILVFLLLAIPILGMGVRAWLVVEGAAREGARELAITGDVNAARARVTKEVTEVGGLAARDTKGNLLFGPGDVEITLTGSAATVAVTYRQPTFLPNLGNLIGVNLGSYFTVKGKATFRPEMR